MNVNYLEEILTFLRKYVCLPVHYLNGNVKVSKSPNGLCKIKKYIYLLSPLRI